MATRFSVVDITFDENTGVSTAIISTPIGLFTGTSVAKGTDADKEKISSFYGCDIAFLKAQKKYFKREISNLKQQIKGIKLLATQAPNPNTLKKTAESLISQLNEQIKEAQQNYNHVEQRLVENSKDRQDFLNRLDKIRKRKENPCE